MNIKLFLYKIKKDFQLIRRYPTYDNITGLETDYNEYWRKKRNTDKPVLSTWQKKRADLIIKMIKPNSTIVDIGCGDGAVLDYINKKHGCRGVGIDISEEILNKAESLGIKTFKINVNNFNELEKVPMADYILGLEVIEHMPNPEKFINIMSKKAKESMIFSFPNTGYYAHRLRLLFGRFPMQWVTHPGEHLRFWTVKDVEWWLKSMNYNLIDMKLYKGLKLFNKIMPKLFSQGIVINVKK